MCVQGRLLGNKRTEARPGLVQLCFTAFYLGDGSEPHNGHPNTESTGVFLAVRCKKQEKGVCVCMCASSFSMLTPEKEGQSKSECGPQ